MIETRINILDGIPAIDDNNVYNEVQLYVAHILDQFEMIAEHSSETLKQIDIDSLSNITEVQERLEEVASRLY